MSDPDLIAALRPFVEDFIAAGVPETVPDGKRWQEVDEFSELTIGDFRRAVAAVASVAGDA